MITKIVGEQPFQVLTNNFSISPSSEGYTLQISADGVNYSNLFTVGAGVTRLVTGVAANSYYKLSGNQSQVSINWMKMCVTEGQGGGNAGELEPVTAFPVGAPEGTVVALASGDTVGVYQYDGSDWVAVGGGSPFDPTEYYTKSQTDAAITAATEDLASEEYVDDAIEEALTGISFDNYWTSAETKSYVDNAASAITSQVEDVERVTATALTELHTDVLALSAATPDMSNYYTKSEVDAEITGATEGFASEEYVDAAITSATQDFVTEDALTGYTSEQDFEDFQDAISVKEEVIASAITELHDSIPDVSDFVTTGDIQNFVTSGDVATQISAATQNMVESTSISTIWSGNQAQYDAISVKDPNTFYIIKNTQ